MKKVQRVLFYLFLNVMVSAAVTLGVLWWWERTHPPVTNDCAPTAAVITPAAETTLASPVDLPPLDEPVVQIENVFGVGDPQSEVVVISRIGEGDLSLAGWSLLDQDGNVYTFPQLSLSKGSVQVYTYPGTSDLQNGLHWGLTEAVWEIGETATILDSQGNIRATYLIP